MIDLLLNRLTNVKSKGKNTWIACCPAHDDKTPSLAIKELPDGRILMKCFAECDIESILSSLSLSLSDLFPKGMLGEYRSFVRLESDLRASQQDKYFREKTILAIADADRAAGKRLSPEDMQREKSAYLKLRRAGIIT
jgi:hypothetical protein